MAREIPETTPTPQNVKSKKIGRRVINGFYEPDVVVDVVTHYERATINRMYYVLSKVVVEQWPTRLTETISFSVSLYKKATRFHSRDTEIARKKHAYGRDLEEWALKKIEKDTQP